MEDIAANHRHNDGLPSPGTSAGRGPSPSQIRYDDDEDEGDVCRICRNPGDPDNPLRYPCSCSGSIKFVCQDCLLQWFNHSNARQCEEAIKLKPGFPDAYLNQGNVYKAMGMP